MLLGNMLKLMQNACVRVCVCVCSASSVISRIYSPAVGLFRLPTSDFPSCQPVMVKSWESVRDAVVCVSPSLFTENIVAVHFL